MCLSKRCLQTINIKYFQIRVSVLEVPTGTSSASQLSSLLEELTDCVYYCYYDLPVRFHTQIYYYIYPVTFFWYVSWLAATVKSLTGIHTLYTVEPLLNDTLNKGHHRSYLPTKDTFRGAQNMLFHDTNMYIFHLWRVGNLSTVDKLAGPNVSFCREVSLYS